MSEKCHEQTCSTAEIAKRKAARRRLFDSNLMIVDQATINAGFDFRRYLAKGGGGY